MNMDVEMNRMREEEQKWMEHLNKLKYASETRRQQIEASGPQREEHKVVDEMPQPLTSQTAGLASTDR